MHPSDIDTMKESPRKDDVSVFIYRLLMGGYSNPIFWPGTMKGETYYTFRYSRPDGSPISVVLDNAEIREAKLTFVASQTNKPWDSKIPTKFWLRLEVIKKNGKILWKMKK